MSNAVVTSTRRHSWVRTLATAALLFYVVGMVAGFAFRAVGHESLRQGFVVPFTAYAVVGWVIASRRPRTALGWLFLGIGILTVLGVVTDAVIAMALQRGWQCRGIVMVSAWIQLWFWYPTLLMSTAYTMLLFPNGLPSRRWRPVVVVLTVTTLAMVVMAALAPEVDFGKAKVPNPIGIHSGIKDVEQTPVFTVAGIIIVACLVSSVVSLGLRFRRSTGVQRAQLKWFFLGASCLGVVIALSMVSKSFNNSTADDFLVPVAMTALPLSCGLAVLRYRLYDIDRVVSRTVSYVVVTGLVVGVYIGVVALIESVLGFSSSIGVAASTLAAAAAFQPIRRRVQRVIDRRFDRAAYDARRTVEVFAQRLRDQVDVDAVTHDLLDTVATAVVPAQASLWLVDA